MRMQRIRTALTLAAAVALVACGAAPTPAAQSTATPAPVVTASPTVAPTVAAATNSPKAAGFVSTVLLERKRNLGASAPSYIRIAPATATDGDAIQAKIASGEMFVGSFRAVTTRTDATGQGLYESSDLPPLAAGMYTEGLREVVIQPDGRSAAHKHAGFEVVLVLDGTVLVRTGLAAPLTVKKGQGFTYSVANSPIQLFNVGGTVARTLVYSLTAEGLPFSTEIETSP